THPLPAPAEPGTAPGPTRAAAAEQRAESDGVLPGQGRQAGEPGRQHGPAVLGHPAGVRPVPPPPDGPLEARAVLGLRRLLRRAATAAERPGWGPRQRPAARGLRSP